MFWKYDDEEEQAAPVQEEPTPLPEEYKFLKNIPKERQEEIIQEVEQYKKEEGARLYKAIFGKDDFKSSDETGSEKRFEKRVAVFKQEDKPVYKHHSWWFVHNCIAHPLIGILPCKTTFDFHDWTSKKINGK